VSASSRTDRPLLTMLIALVGVGVFVLIRLAALGGDASRFVLAGQRLSDPAQVPRELYVIRDSAGYDGQAFYRLGLDPFTREKTAHGITLDTPPYRQQRIGYPLIAWIASGGGSPRALAWALIAINVAAVAVVGFIGALLAQTMRRHAIWGLAFAIHPGFIVSVARDLSEPTAAAFMLAGLLYLRRSQSTAAAMALTAAVLTRETTAVVPIGLGIAWITGGVLVRRAKKDRRPAREFLGPLGVLAAWQILLTVWWGQVPFTSNKNATTGPFVGLARQVRAVLTHATANSVTQLIEIAFIASVAIAAIVVLRSESVLSHERWALVAALVSSTLLSASVWTDHAHFLRALTEVYLLGTLVLVAAWPKRPVALMWAASLVTASVATIFARNL